MEGQFSSKMVYHVTKMWFPLKSGCLLQCNGNYNDIKLLNRSYFGICTVPLCSSTY